MRTNVTMQYENLLHTVLTTGVQQDDRTGVGTRSIFGGRMRFHLGYGFPLVTTKRVHMKSVVHELLWFLSGSTNVRDLQKHGVTIWDEWADENGELGPVYGEQWRSWRCREGHTIDQISEAVHLLRTNPHSRRNLVTAWNPGDIDETALPPCHVLFQFYVANNRLSCQLYQRSADMFLGVPFNIASYALLTHMMAQQANLDVGELIWVGGDCHIYNNHVEQVTLQLDRNARPMPALRLTKRDSIFDYQYDDVQIIGYDPHPGIAAPVAV